MARHPQKPLARVIAQRRNGVDPDLESAEARVARARARKTALLRRMRVRMLLAGAAFCLAFAGVSARLVSMAANGPEPVQTMSRTKVSSKRADITDRHGRVLATNLPVRSLYAHPHQMIEPERVARELGALFPDLDAEKLLQRFSSPLKFMWLQRRLSPEMAQAVHDIGDPGLVLGHRETRLFPNGPVAAHTLGSAGYGDEDIDVAEVVGRDGVERWFDTQLRADPETPLALSLDLTVQLAMRRLLAGGMRLMNAKGASAVLMDIRTGELIALVSLPDFDPNSPPAPTQSIDPSDSPAFNRAVLGLYELGSTLKPVTAAIAMQTGIAGPDTLVDTKPLKWGRFSIREFANHDYGPFLSLTDVIVKSSNRGTARLAIEFGTEMQQEMLGKLGLLDPVPLELPAARIANPVKPPRWSEISTITISYGHGLSISPLHLATAYATLLGGGTKVTPTLLRRDTPMPQGERVVTPEISQALLAMLRKVVSEGTASQADVPGYQVAGKTGTAEKPRPTGGGYMEDKVIANFASVFPGRDPAYVLVVTLDEPEYKQNGKIVRTAGWTAAPVTGAIIGEIGPLLGIAPEFNAEE